MTISPSTPKTLHWYDHISINLFWLGLNFRNNAVNSVFMPYLVALFAPAAIKNTALGEMRTAGLIIAMLVQPAMGLLSDRSTSRFGRRRPFIFVGVILDLVFLVAIGLSWNYWALLVATLLIQFSSNISHGALQGLIPDMVPVNQRGTSSGVKSIFELVPLILVSLVIANMVGAQNLKGAIIVTAIVLLVTMLLTMVLVKEEPLKEKPTDPLGPPMKRVVGMLLGILGGGAAGLLIGGVIGGLFGLVIWPFAGVSIAQEVGYSLGGLIAMTVAVLIGVWSGTLATLGKEARENPSFTWWVVNRLFFMAAVTSIQAFAPYFLMYVFKISIEEATVLDGRLITAVGLFTVASALLCAIFSDKIGHQKLMAISGTIAAVGTFLLMATDFYPSVTLMYVAGAILGIATGIFTTTNWALGTRLAPSTEAGRYLGISNLAGAGAGMVGTGIGGPIADRLNALVPGMGYFVLFGCYGIMFLLSTLTLRWINKRA